MDVKKQRDYRAEYQARIHRGISRGASRSQARGHGGRETSPLYDRKIEKAAQAFRETRSLTKSSRLHHVSAERLRRYARENRLVRKVRGKWQFLKDIRSRTVPLFTDGQFRVVTVKGFGPASKGFKFMIDADRFLHTNDRRYIVKWEGEGVEDMDGRWVPFETRPNVLYRLNAVEREPFEMLYKITI